MYWLTTRFECPSQRECNFAMVPVNKREWARYAASPQRGWLRVHHAIDARPRQFHQPRKLYGMYLRLNSMLRIEVLPPATSFIASQSASFSSLAALTRRSPKITPTAKLRLVGAVDMNAEKKVRGPVSAGRARQRGLNMWIRMPCGLPYVTALTNSA